mmetsp:Transcript_30249/g.46165  ORF Transcript_30249/g.46165 Transcript_30249/m.46165 type:complete len:89 (+) Transcript_30249:1073-1339(+)
MVSIIGKPDIANGRQSDRSVNFTIAHFSTYSDDKFQSVANLRKNVNLFALLSRHVYSLERREDWWHHFLSNRKFQNQCSTYVVRISWV